MRLLLDGGEAFSESSAGFEIRPSGEGETANRIFIAVKFGLVRTTAILDTGAPYSICAPELVPLLGIDHSARLDSIQIQMRGLRVPGELHRMTMTFLSDDGNNVEVDATVFVPTQLPDESLLNELSFVGYGGTLERMRFAIDSVKEVVYFSYA